LSIATVGRPTEILKIFHGKENTFSIANFTISEAQRKKREKKGGWGKREERTDRSDKTKRKNKVFPMFRHVFPMVTAYLKAFRSYENGPSAGE
jgi:hypothetical protein